MLTLMVPLMVRVEVTVRYERADTVLAAVSMWNSAVPPSATVRVPTFMYPYMDVLVASPGRMVPPASTLTVTTCARPDSAPPLTLTARLPKKSELMLDWRRLSTPSITSTFLPRPVCTVVMVITPEPTLARPQPESVFLSVKSVPSEPME